MSSPHVCDLLVVRVFPLRCTLGCTRAADEARHEPATRTDTVRNESLTHHMVDELGHLRSATVRRCGLRRDEDEDDVQVFPEADKGHLRAKFLWIGVELSCFLCPFRIFGVVVADVHALPVLHVVPLAEAVHGEDAFGKVTRLIFPDEGLCFLQRVAGSNELFGYIVLFVLVLGARYACEKGDALNCLVRPVAHSSAQVGIAAHAARGRSALQTPCRWYNTMVLYHSKDSQGVAVACALTTRPSPSEPIECTRASHGLRRRPTPPCFPPSRACFHSKRIAARYMHAQPCAPLATVYDSCVEASQAHPKRCQPARTALRDSVGAKLVQFAVLAHQDGSYTILYRFVLSLQ